VQQVGLQLLFEKGLACLRIEVGFALVMQGTGIWGSGMQGSVWAPVQQRTPD
jgi:hypothetical protein